MALNDINLNPVNIEKLYGNFLLEKAKSSTASNTIITANESLPFLGQNLKSVIILVNQKDAKYLLEEELDFLTSILSACYYSIADVAIINCKHTNAELFDQIKATFSIKSIILFNVNMASVGFPLTIPNYQVQLYDNLKLLAAPDLLSIKKDKAEKNGLWTSLKKLFEI